MSTDDTTDEFQGGGAPAWMMTYGDTITLLVTFFVLLMTFSTSDPEDFHKFTLHLLGRSRRKGVFDTSDVSASLIP